MREFMRGWSRKSGCITLLLACVFMAGWVRSEFVEDGIYFCPFNGLTAFVESGNQSFCGAVDVDLKNRTSFVNALSWQSNPNDSSSGGRRQLANKNYMWHLRTCGFALGNLFSSDLDTSTGKNTQTLQGPTFWIIPYWSIVIPLTALSTYLLLSKPRQSNQMKIPEPIANKGT